MMIDKNDQICDDEYSKMMFLMNECMKEDSSTICTENTSFHKGSLKPLKWSSPKRYSMGVRTKLCGTQDPIVAK